MTKNRISPFDAGVLCAVARLQEDAFTDAIILEVTRLLGRDVAIGAPIASLLRLERLGFIRSFPSSADSESSDHDRFYELDAAGSIFRSHYDYGISEEALFARLGLQGVHIT